MLFFSSTWTNARRHAAIALTLLFVAGQFSAGLHLAVVEHVACEHGEIVHGKHGASEATPTNIALGNTNARAQSDTNGNDSEEGETHDHCDVSLLENTTCELHAFVGIEHPAFSLVQVEALVHTGKTGWNTWPQYRIAPKQSPPFSVL